VFVEAKYEMPDWEVRNSCAAAIYFEDKKFLLTGKEKAGHPYSFRYVLQPWPEGKSSNPKMFHTYDAEAVAERDSEQRGELFGKLALALLLPLYPFLGLLWSGTQARLNRFGFVPRALTGISIFTTLALLMSQGVMTSIMLNASARSGHMMIGGIIRAFVGHNDIQIGPVAFPVAILDALLLVVLLVDLPVRYSHYLREDQWTGGLLEWLVPKSLRRK
jgi:hypothetical protein